MTGSEDKRKAGVPPAEWDAASYHRLSAPQFSWGVQVLERLCLNGDETVMDAGCGTGRLTAGLLERLPRGRVVAVDLSRNMLEEARSHLAPRFGGRVEFVRADLAGLPFNKAFDGVFSTAALHWIPDHPRLFRSLYGSLKPGGWLVAQCGGGPNIARLMRRASAEVLPDLVATLSVVGRVRRDLDCAAVRVEQEVVRRLLVVEAHHAVAALVHALSVAVVSVPLSGVLPLLTGVDAAGSRRGD